MRKCHVCGQSWTAHAHDCRIRDDIDRMRRIHDRMIAEGRTDALRHRIKTYLDLFGALPCQHRDGLPSPHDCASCGHGDICVMVQTA